MNYNKAKIYKIINNIDDEIYIGSTVCSLAIRMAKHRWSMKDKRENNRKLYIKMQEIGLENFRILLLENYPCDNIEELRKREGEYIKDLQPSLNSDIAGRTLKEWRDENKDYMIQWRETNKDHIKSRDKERYERNKSENIERSKKYNKAHRDEILERNKIPIKCECGLTVTKSWLSRHCKTKRHINNLRYVNE